MSAPRTLHRPDAVVLHTDYRTPEYWKALRRVDQTRETGTIVLEPTPVQLSTGVRILWITPDEAYGGIATLHDAALARGWRAGISQSRYLSEPTNAGAIERRGRRLEYIVQALRVRNDGLAAWATWKFDVERAKWTPEGGQCALVTPAGLLGVIKINVTQLEKMIKGSEVS